MAWIVEIQGYAVRAEAVARLAPVEETERGFEFTAFSASGFVLLRATSSRQKEDVETLARHREQLLQAMRGP